MRPPAIFTNVPGLFGSERETGQEIVRYLPWISEGGMIERGSDKSKDVLTSGSLVIWFAHRGEKR
jgi:hypothetical protein